MGVETALSELRIRYPNLHLWTFPSWSELISLWDERIINYLIPDCLTTYLDTNYLTIYGTLTI